MGVIFVTVLMAVPAAAAAAAARVAYLWGLECGRTEARGRHARPRGTKRALAAGGCP